MLNAIVPHLQRLVCMTDDTRALRPKTLWKLALLLLIIAVSFLGIPWLTHERQLLPEAAHTLDSDALVMVTHDPWLTFTPAQDAVTTGFIFYPGGRIAPEGYAPLMKTIAAAGYLVIVPDMPLNIAAFRPNIADRIIDAYPELDHWVISGHSVGGAMASQYTQSHSESIDGLAIWASYPPNKADLSNLDLPVVLIYGGRETGVTDEAVAQRKHLLPADTVYVRIEGGDHHQFGSYEIPPEDHLATVSREIQHEQTTRATLDVLNTVSAGE
jgi:predicted esterase